LLIEYRELDRTLHSIDFIHLLTQQASHFGAHREGLGFFKEKDTDISTLFDFLPSSVINSLSKFHLRPIRKEKPAQVL
jgi:hypothetical protein